MLKILCSQIARIIKSKKKLEETLNLKLTNRGRELSIVGTPENEYVGQKVIDAINFGFLVSTALLIKTEDNVFEILDIKDHTRRKDMKTIRGRLIGTGGRTLKTITDVSNSHVEIKDNNIAIIAPGENIEAIQNGIISIIHGSKQTNIYAFLEKNRPKPIGDLGLK
jgi:ribosomal RNA assembly protein